MKNLYILLLLLITTISSCVKDLPKKNPLDGLPIVSTQGIYEVTAKSFKVYSRIESDAYEELIEKGFCWGVDTLPTLLNSSTSNTTFYSSNLDYTSRITNFQSAKVYYIRAYVKTKEKVAYGNDLKIRTNGYSSVLKDIDGNQYKTVVIGKQEWMAENLKVTKFNNGTPISNISDNSIWLNNKKNALCYYDNNQSNKILYGNLYNGYVIQSATTNNLNVCPIRWHIPSSSDWDVLEGYVRLNDPNKPSENGSYAARSLKADGENLFYFSALTGGGYRKSDAYFEGINNAGNWWTSDFSMVEIGYLNWLEGGDNMNLLNAFSIRCIKD